MLEKTPDLIRSSVGPCFPLTVFELSLDFLTSLSEARPRSLDQHDTTDLVRQRRAVRRGKIRFLRTHSNNSSIRRGQ